MTDEPTARVSDEITASDDVLVEDALVEDVLVEEVSIDGMCGVY